MHRSTITIAVSTLLLVVLGMTSCGSSANPNLGRVLTGITVTPATADAQSFANGQVVFTATGTFSLPPTPAPVPFLAPYAGQFVVDNPSNSTIATVVGQGNGTVTVQCAAGAAGTVFVVASASANNGSTIVVSGSGQLTCP